MKTHAATAPRFLHRLALTAFMWVALATLGLSSTGCPSDDKPVCTPECSGRVCGDDGCGGTCGTCGDGQTCTAQGQCIGGVVCEGITVTGCCTADATTVKYCDKGELATLACDNGAVCGFRQEASVYACGFEEDPAMSSDLPFLCPGETCGPETCQDQECGFDCGQSCGTCGAGDFCEAGQCKACSCDGRQCGTDECGNDCGSCAAGDVCNTSSGQCEPDLCDGINFEGCCTGDGKLKFCDNGILSTFGCGLKGTCGWRNEAFGFDCTLDGQAPPAGTAFLCPGETCDADPPCGERQCGFECGVACGSCDTGESCDDFTGQCVACSCDGKNCGDNGCGESCGTCGDGEICDRDTQVCKADQCGQVSGFGCCKGDETAVDCINGELTEVDCKEFGQTCGWNGINYGCTNYQAASPDPAYPYQCPGEGCATTCDDIECGFACGVLCGECGEGQWCDGKSCKPCTCAGVECGSDGCGNGCGVCASDEVCDEFKGTCDKDGCFFTDFVGCCAGQVQHTCGWQGASAVLCANSCGWDADEGAYRCGGQGEDPSGTHPIACQAIVFP